MEMYTRPSRLPVSALAPLASFSCFSHHDTSRRLSLLALSLLVGSRSQQVAMGYSVLLLRCYASNSKPVLADVPSCGPWQPSVSYAAQQPSE
jgi:hypothetical protein